MTVVSAVIRRLAEGLPGGFLFQRLSGDLTLRAQTRGRRGPCRLARTARARSPARAGVAEQGARRVVWVLTWRAQTRGRRGPCRLARTARPMSPARSGVAGRMPRALVTVSWAVSTAIW